MFKLGSMLVTAILNPTTRGQTLWRSVHLEIDITTCSDIAEIQTLAFCLALSPGDSQILSRSRGENQFFPQLKDEIREWPGIEATFCFQ